MDKMCKSVIIDMYTLEGKNVDKNTENTKNELALQHAPIGVIDSGVGGLSVLKCLQRKLPKESFIYVGDTARTPYGSRSETEIRSFVEEMLAWLEKQGVKMVVVACNTLTMLGIDSLKGEHSFVLVGMSKGERLLLSASKNKKMGVLATQFTINTEAHKNAILAADADAEVYGVACPKFVPLIEGEGFDNPALAQAVAEYTNVLKEHNVDALILGCTHYPFIKDMIEAAMDNKAVVIDPAEETAVLTASELQRHAMCNQEGGSVKICCTADIERVQRLAARMLNDVECSFSEISLK